MWVPQKVQASLKVPRIKEVGNTVLDCNIIVILQISKPDKKEQPSTSMASDLDMYADDFDLKEKEKLESTSQINQEEPEEVATGTIILIKPSIFQ